MSKSSSQPSWLTAEVREHIRRAAYEFHVRAFGEELARINFLPLEARKRSIAEMMDHAREKGVKLEKPALGVTR